ncbi:MAG: deoxynucleoside kinase [Patescibacteria group bacterium]|nr:deoxynucleoside kinase [Patescibacteria group bacterium]
MNTGKLIVIDGTDGSGKATQTELLRERLIQEGMKVRKIDFPRYESNVFGKLLFECLKENKHGDFLSIDPKIASTLYAVDRFESSEEIRQWMKDDYHVVTDRYVSANQIHQGGKITDDKAREEFLSWLEKVEFGVFKIPKPDVIIYLHVPIEISLELIKKRATETGTSADQAESNAKHLLESQQSAVKLVEKANSGWIKVDCIANGAMRSPKDINDEIFNKIKDRL